MKKKIASLLLTALVASTVAACTPADDTTTTAGTTPGTTTAGETTPGTTTADGTTTPGDSLEDPKASITVQAEGSWLPYYEAAVTALKDKYPDSTVEIVEVGSFDNLDAIDSTDATNTDIPDVFALPFDRLSSMISKEALAPIDAEKMAQDLGGYPDFVSVGSVLKDGEDYLAFPMNIETLITFVNPNNAEAQGVDLTQPFEMADQENFALAVTAYDAWFGVAFANAVDLELLGKNEDGTFYSDMTKEWSELSEDQQGMINELHRYWQRVYADKPELWDEQAAGGAINDMFNDGGEVVYKIDGPWGTPGLVEAVPELDVMPLSQITVNGSPLKHWQGLWALGINSRNEGDEAKMTLATELIKEILNPANAEEFFNITGKIMANVPAADYEATGLSDIEKKTIAATIESFEISENRPLFSEWGNVWDTWKNALVSWNNGQPATGEEAYSALKDSFTAMMGNLGQ